MCGTETSHNNISIISLCTKFIICCSKVTFLQLSYLQTISIRIGSVNILAKLSSKQFYSNCLQYQNITGSCAGSFLQVCLLTASRVQYQVTSITPLACSDTRRATSATCVNQQCASTHPQSVTIMAGIRSIDSERHTFDIHFIARLWFARNSVIHCGLFTCDMEKGLNTKKRVQIDLNCFITSPIHRVPITTVETRCCL